MKKLRMIDALLLRKIKKIEKIEKPDYSKYTD